MKYLFWLSTLALILTISQTIHASKPIPQQCPSVQAIQAAGIRDLSFHDTWTATQKSFYDTKYEWVFTMLFSAKDADEARQIAISALPKLHISNGPYSDGAFATCHYATHFNDENYVYGIATTSLS